LTGCKLSVAELERTHPGAASSLREGIAETLTLTRLGIKGSLKRTLASTNPCESMIECVRRTSRNVKRWRSGEMCLRWTTAGMLEAERQFRRVIGYRDLATLVVAIERDLAGTTVRSRPRGQWEAIRLVMCGLTSPPTRKPWREPLSPPHPRSP
jgi:putative transposase